MSKRATIGGEEAKAMVRRAQEHELRGQFQQALALGRKVASAQPGWALGHYCVGSALCGLGMLDEADSALGKAIARDDSQSAFFTRRGEVLNRLGHHEEAMACVARARELSPDNPRVLVVSAMVQWLGGDAPGALELLDAALGRGVDDAALQNVHALLCGQLGRLDEGIANLEGLLSQSRDGQSLHRLLHSEIRMHLAKLLDKAGRYDEAFEQARRGGALRETGYDPARISASCDDRLAAFGVERFGSIPQSRLKSELAVFIVGMPRSGTSLVEQIIASHPGAYGGGELLEAYRAGRELIDPNAMVGSTVEMVEALKPAALDRCGRRVLKAMEKAGKREKGAGVERVSDKLPNNYELVGIIHKMLPGARFIHCRRGALDTCLSCFLLDFVGDTNHGYSYDLANLAHQYRVYERYMEHWGSIGSIPMLDVEYESLVADPEGGARRIIEFIGLGWDDACARSHETRRAVSTLSSDQVRKPMYTSSVGRWKNYEKDIGVLIDALGTGDR